MNKLSWQWSTPGFNKSPSSPCRAVDSYKQAKLAMANSGLLVVPKIGTWSRIRNFPKKRSDLSRFSEHWWNFDLFRLWILKIGVLVFAVFSVSRCSKPENVLNLFRIFSLLVLSSMKSDLHSENVLNWFRILNFVELST